MNNVFLQHYQRKKFFYRFFMRKSPRTGVMFGLAWIYMTVSLFPFVFFAMFSVFSKYFYFVTLLIRLLSAFLFYLYGAILCILGLMKIFLPVFRSKKLSFDAGCLSTLILPFLGVILLPVLIIRKRFTAAFFALVGILAFSLYFFGGMTIFPLFAAGGICLLAALAGVEDKHRFSWRFMIPLGIVAGFNLFLFWYDGKLELDVRSEREKLSQLVGRPLQVEEFWARESGGVPVDREPLKTLIAQNPRYIDWKVGNHPVDAARNELQRIQRENPLFVKALDEFLNLPSGIPFAHQKPENDLLASVLLPEMNVLRNSAYFLALKIVVEADNKPRVQEYCRNLSGIRDRLLKNNFLISHLVAIAVESVRLDTLEAVLAGGAFSKEEFFKLVGDPVDWNRYLRFAYVDEAVMFKNDMDFILSKSESSGLNNYLIILTMMSTSRPPMETIVRMKKYYSPFVHVFSLRDYRFALRTFIKACSVPPTLSGLEKARLAAVDEKEIKRNHYFFSGMLLPAFETVYARDSQITDLRQMVLLGAEVMEYRRKTGKLPRDLTFLPQIPLAELDHRPIMYEATSDGFRLYTHTREGKIPAADDSRNTFKVRLRK